MTDSRQPTELLRQLRAQALRADADKLDDLAKHEAAAAAAVGFGSDLAAQQRATARKFRKLADEIDRRAASAPMVDPAEQAAADRWDGMAPDYAHRPETF